jgi:hypothetical protein
VMESLKSRVRKAVGGGDTRSAARSDIYIIDCDKQIGGHDTSDPEALAKGMESMIAGGDGLVTAGNIILATVERVERHGNVVRVYVTPLAGIERGSTN